MNRKPAITVLMTIYQDKDYLKEAVKSILNQSYRNFEFLIIAEPETPDESLEIIRAFHDKRIRLVINKKHLGFSNSLNKGIEVARGKYIARMDADDLSMKNRILLQVLYMKFHPNISVCGSNVQYIDEKGKLLFKSSMPLLPKEITVWLHFSNAIYHPSIMGHKEIFRTNKYKSQPAEDYELWTRICTKHKIANLHLCLLKRRMHGKNAVFENKVDIYKCDLDTQKKLWETDGIKFLLTRPFYDTKQTNRKERINRRKMIEKLEMHTSKFMTKKKLFKEIYHQWGE